MCGICGVVQLGGGPARPVIAPPALDRMTDAMTHRGPDDRGTYLADGIALGVRRLSIVDVVDGHQPFSNEDASVWAVQNGELYNHDAVRRGLRADGHTFASRCDTEVIPHLYERHGDDFVAQLHGMFGIALWDGRRRRAVLARDRLGIKPLYYAVAGDLLVFASELKGLLAGGLVEPDLDYEAIDAFLTIGFVPGPRTPLASVSKLLPGHRLVVEDGRHRVERWWSYPTPAPAPTTLDDAVLAVRELLDASVRERLMSDVPLGAMLSGGIDSSVIVALMAERASGPLKTFSVGFAEAGPGNELDDARLVARAFGTEHHELELSLADRSVDLAELVWHLDEPVADLSSLGFLALSELAASEVTVALSGQGADELFGGYRKHRAASVAAQWDRAPGFARAGGAWLLAHGPERGRRAAATLAARDAAARLLAMSGTMTPAQRARLLRGPLAELDGDSVLRAMRSALGDVRAGPLPDTLYLDAQFGLVDDMLHYFDRASMAHSLEVRVPFLDHRLVEYAATIPPALKVRRLETKVVLKRLARGLVPDRIIDKPKVGFFNSAVDGWFRAQASGAVADYLLAPRPRYAELIDRGEVERIVARQRAGDAAQASTLLSVLMLELWLSEYLPRALAGARAPTPVPAG